MYLWFSCLVLVFLTVQVCLVLIFADVLFSRGICCVALFGVCVSPIDVGSSGCFPSMDSACPSGCLVPLYLSGQPRPLHLWEAAQGLLRPPTMVLRGRRQCYPRCTCLWRYSTPGVWWAARTHTVFLHDHSWLSESRRGERPRGSPCRETSDGPTKRTPTLVWTRYGPPRWDRTQDPVHVVATPIALDLCRRSAEKSLCLLSGHHGPPPAAARQVWLSKVYLVWTKIVAPNWSLPMTPHSSRSTTYSACRFMVNMFQIFMFKVPAHSTECGHWGS